MWILSECKSPSAYHAQKSSHPPSYSVPFSLSLTHTHTYELTHTHMHTVILFLSQTHKQRERPQNLDERISFLSRWLVFPLPSFLPSWNSVNEYRFVHWTSWYSPTNQLLFMDYRWNSHLREVSVVGLSKTLLWTENKLKPKRSKVYPSAYVIYIKNIKKPQSLFLQEELSRGVIERWI